MPMELRTLKYFLAVAEQESFSQAANNVLFVTQPTLSRQMQELEEEIGAQLFVRSNKKTTLTEEGLRFKKRAQEIMELVKHTQKEFAESSKEEITGDVYIGAGETQGFKPIADACKQMQKQYPKIYLNISSGNAEDVTEKLDRGLIDFGLLVEPVDKTKYEYLTLPDRDTWGLLVRKDHPLAKKSKIIARDFANIPLLVSRQTLDSREFTGWLGRDLKSLNIVGTYNLIYNAAVCVEQGMGAALTLERLINTGNDSPFAFVRISPERTSGLVVVWKKNPVFSKPAAQFLKFLKAGLESHSIKD